MTDEDNSKTDELRDIIMNVSDGQEEFTDEQEEDLGRDLTDEQGDARPTTTVQCPNCDNDKARYQMKQIRAADESETRFFQCTECEHKWREDDH